MSAPLSTIESISKPYFVTGEALCRKYRSGAGTVEALSDVSFSLRRGEILALVGASGSGKTTLLNLLAGLDRATSGRITVAGEVISEMKAPQLANYRAQRVGVVFQNFQLLPNRSALVNVEVALYFQERRVRERRARSRAMLEKLGLGDRLHHGPRDLSGGEQQRVAIARALVKQPDLLLADEPTGNLDHENSLRIQQLLLDLNREGLTIVVATHDLALARSIAHRQLVLSYGQIVEQAVPADREGAP